VAIIEVDDFADCLYPQFSFLDRPCEVTCFAVDQSHGKLISILEILLCLISILKIDFYYVSKWLPLDLHIRMVVGLVAEILPGKVYVHVSTQELVGSEKVSHLWLGLLVQTAHHEVVFYTQAVRGVVWQALTCDFFVICVFSIYEHNFFVSGCDYWGTFASLRLFYQFLTFLAYLTKTVLDMVVWLTVLIISHLFMCS